MVMNITTEQVAKIPLFAGMSMDEMRKLLSKLTAVTKHVQKNDYIYLAGDVFDNLCLLVTGTAQIIREDAEGDKSIVGNLAAGDIFGENHFGAGDRRSVVNYLSTADCELLLLPFSRMTMAAIGDSGLYSKFFTNLVSVVAKRNNQLMEKVDILGKKTLRAKIMAYLESEAKQRHARKFSLPFSRTDMANFLDADRSAMTRELSRMEKDGLITFERNVFCLL